jgi:hypothetical protein
MNTNIPVQYITANYLPDDRLAVVALQKTTGEVKQKIASAANIVSAPFQARLRELNSEGFEIYLSVNTLHTHARGRTKADIAEIRHVYLDFDERGDEAIARLQNRKNLPAPNHLLQTSPGKWQAIWRVQGFVKGQDETLMQGLVQELGADKAVHDSARVLRVPGFFNHKYEMPHLVTAQNLSPKIYEPAHFPKYNSENLAVSLGGSHGSNLAKHRLPRHLSQSERDWAYARRALTRGEPPRAVIDAVAAFRFDKPNPRYYAELTVKKALQTLAQSAKVQSVTADAARIKLNTSRHSA